MNDYPLELVLEVAAEDGRTGIAAFLKRHGMPRRLTQDDQGRFVYADTGEPAPCANGCGSRCATCRDEIAKIRLRRPMASDQGRLM